MAVAAILAAAFAPQVAQAQEPPPPHDLALRYRHGISVRADGFISWIFILTNQGGQHAHSGQVKVTFIPYRGDVTVVSSVPIGQAATGLDPKFGHFDPATGIWHFRNLRPGETAELHLYTSIGLKSDGTAASRSQGETLVKGRGEIISSVPKEEPMFRYNNVTHEAWKEFSFGEHAAEGDAVVDMLLRGVLFPQANDTVDFTVRFRNSEAYHDTIHYSHDMHEVRVKVSPSPGLDLVSANAPSGMFGETGSQISISSSFDLSTGIWDLGYVPEPAGHLNIEMPVEVRYTGAVPLEEACLTAELDNVVPPERPALDLTPDNRNTQRNNRGRICLGEDPTVLIRDEIGEHITPATDGDGFRPFTVYPCVGETAYPCTAQDALELVVPISRVDMLERGIGNARNDARLTDFGDATILQPESIVLNVEDIAGVREGNGANLVWRTGSATEVTFNRMDAAGIIPGVIVAFDLPSPAYTSYTFAIAGVGTLPGRMKIVNATNVGFTLLDVESKTSLGPLKTTLEFLSVVVEFGTLGTYVADITMGATHTDTETTDTDTGRYTFHVGPVAELGVRDGGASPLAGTGEVAYTVAAINNGPDAAPAARVTLEGVPEGAEAIPSEGIYTEGACQSGLCRGVWTIGELHTPDGRLASGLTETPTLSLITTLATPADITAAIANTQDYAVCIGSDGNDIAASSETACTGNTGASWHTAAYYDYIGDNDTSTITARSGTGEGHPNAVVGVRATERQAVKILTWQAVEALNGHVVSHYEVQRSASSWTTVADDVVGTMYVDMASETVNPAYRVRAVNIFDVPGPWSEPSAKRPGAPGGFSASGSSDAQATLSWSAPDAVNGVTVTGYDVDFSQDGGNTWTSVATATGQPGTSFTHTDSSLAADTVRQYRVRAVGTVGSGSEQVVVNSDWAFAAATRDYLTPGAPRNFTARAINQSRVDLSWREPEAVADVSLTGYHLEFSTDGNTWNWLPAGQTRTVLSATTTSHEHTDDTLAPGALRQYRVRAVGTGAGNADFESVWVFANAATEAVGQPQNLAATADGRGRIDLTWDQPGFGAGRVTGYRIDYTPASPESWQTLEHGYRTSPRRYEHTSLLPGQEYCYQVAATYAGGTGPFAARACATTEGAPADLPGEPENLRVTQVGRNFVKLAWDKPSVGGEAEYYEWQSNVHEPREVKPGTATGVTVIGLAPDSNYEFQVRAGNSYGHSEWSRSIQVTLNLAGHSVKVSTQELEVEKGGSGSFNVSLNQAPRWPLLVYFHSIGPECLTEGLVYQQHRILLPTNPMYPSKEFWEDAWWGPPEDRYALPWNEGLDLQIDASLCQGGETTVVEPIFNSLPFSELEGLPMWEELGLDEEDWREKWGVDRLDGTTGPSVKVTVTDDGSGTGTQ